MDISYKHLHQTHHPEQFDHIFSVTVVLRDVIFHHFTQRVDELPGPPVMLKPDNVDVIDDACNRLERGERRSRIGSVVHSIKQK